MNINLSPTQDLIADFISQEFARASNKFPRFNSEHEGYAVILEELDELWAAIMANKTSTNLQRMSEAIQVGAMAMRFIHDLATEYTLHELMEGKRG